MPVSRRCSQPKYRHFKPKDLAVVRIGGRDFYLGKYESPESWQKYYQLLAQSRGVAKGKLVASSAENAPTFVGINMVIEAYLEFAKSYYAADSVRTNEYDNLRYALAPLCELFGLANTNAFGPKSLLLVRQHMIALGWSRKVINSRANRIKRCFKWASPRKWFPLRFCWGCKLFLDFARVEARHGRPSP